MHMTIKNIFYNKIKKMDIFNHETDFVITCHQYIEYKHLVVKLISKIWLFFSLHIIIAGKF